MEALQSDIIVSANILADAIYDLGFAIVVAAFIRGFLNK